MIYGIFIVRIFYYINYEMIYLNITLYLLFKVFLIVWLMFSSAVIGVTMIIVTEVRI